MIKPEFKNLKYIGENTFYSFENFSINYFYDIVSSNLPTLDKKYILYIESVDYTGISYSEWLVFDVTVSNLFTAVEELHFHLLNSINKHSIFSNDLISTIIFEDDKDRVIDDTIKHINITFYEVLK